MKRTIERANMRRFDGERPLDGLCGSPRNESSLQLACDVWFIKTWVWQTSFNLKALRAANFDSVSSALCLLACILASIWEYRGCLQGKVPFSFKYRSMVNILNSKKNTTATITIAAYTTSPSLAWKELNLHNYLPWTCSRRPSSILNKREPGGKIVHFR